MTAQVQADGCSDLLARPNFAKVTQLIRNLNPKLLAEIPPQIELLYIKLKSEDWRYRGQAIPAELEAHLKRKFARKFNLASHSDATQFYLNFLYSYEIRIADLWRAQKVRELVGASLDPNLEAFATHLLDSFFSPNALNDKALRSEDAEAFFKTRPWENFPWPKALAAVVQFKIEKPDARAYEFPNWYHGDMDWNQVGRISIALLKQRRPGMCCLSEPGCARCPLNRGFRAGKN